MVNFIDLYFYCFLSYIICSDIMVCLKFQEGSQERDTGQGQQPSKIFLNVEHIRQRVRACSKQSWAQQLSGPSLHMNWRHRDCYVGRSFIDSSGASTAAWSNCSMVQLLPVAQASHVGTSSSPEEFWLFHFWCNSLIMHLGNQWRGSKCLGLYTYMEYQEEAFDAWLQIGPIQAFAALGEWTSEWKKCISVSPSLCDSVFQINNS